NLDRVFLLKPVVDERRSRVIAGAVVNVGIRQWHIFQHCGGNGIDLVLGNTVVRKRIAHDDAIDGSARSRVIDNDWAAQRISQTGKVPGPFGCCWKYHAEVSRLHVVIVLSSEPKERPVLDDGTANTAAEKVVGIVWFPNTGFLAEKVIFLRPDGTRLEEARAVKVVGPGL